MVFQTLRGLAFLPPRFSSHLPSPPLPPGHTRSFPPTLPSSKYVAVFPDGSEQRQGSRPHPFRRLRRSPILFRLKSKHRCLTCTLQTGEGAWRRAPLPTPAPPTPSQPGPQAPNTAREPQGLFLFHVCAFFSSRFLFPGKEKLFQGRGEPEPALGFRWGRGTLFCQERKGEGGEQTRRQLSLATHCAISSEATLLPRPFFFP